MVAEWLGLLCVEQNIASGFEPRYIIILLFFFHSQKFSVHNGIHYSGAITVVAEWFGLLCVGQNIAGSSLAVLNFFSIFFLSSRRMSVHSDNGIPTKEAGARD